MNKELWQQIEVAERQYRLCEDAVDTATMTNLGEALVDRLIAKEKLMKLLEENSTELVESARPRCEACNGRRHLVGMDRVIEPGQPTRSEPRVCPECHGTGKVPYLEVEYPRHYVGM